MEARVRPLALYGLAANPPHRGHWSCVSELVGAGYDVLVAPSYAHAFGKRVAPFDMRARWLGEAGREFGALGDHAWVWREEESVGAAKPEGAPVFSIEMLERARSMWWRNPVLAIGPDNARPEVFSRFAQHERIAAEFGVVEIAQKWPTRSSDIREHVLKIKAVDPWLLEAVGSSIAQSVAEWFANQGSG